MKKLFSAILCVLLLAAAMVSIIISSKKKKNINKQKINGLVQTNEPVYLKLTLK